MSKSYAHTFRFKGAVRRFIFVTEDEIGAQARWERALKATDAAANDTDDQDKFWHQLVGVMKAGGFHQVRE